MINKIISFFLIISFAFIGPLRAQDWNLPVPTLLEDEIDPGASVSPLKKNQRAPFTGVLLSPMAVALLTTKLNSLDEEIQLELNKLRAELMAEMKLKLDNQKSTYEADISILNSNLESVTAQRQSLYEQLQNEIKNRPSKPLWFSLGVLSGVGLTIGILFAISNSGI